MKIILYKGYHSPLAYQNFVRCYDSNELILFLPPTLTDYSFLEKFPPGESLLIGELWEDSPQLPKRKAKDPVHAIAGVFTSGTTDAARLVLYSKTNLESSCQNIYELFDRERLQSLFCFPQPFHTFGLTLGYAASHILGLHIKFPEGKYSRKAHEDWRAQINDCTLTLGTPTHFYDLIAEQKQRAAIKNSYSCIIGGAKVKKQLWADCQDILNIEFPSIGYGATEASPGLTHLPPGVKPKEDGEIGIPLPHVEIQLSETGLTFSGPNLCCGIFESDELYFPETFELPDIIRVRDDDGHWVYETRANWFLNRGGEKFSLEKLENQIYHETGWEALCCSLPDPRLGEDLGILLLQSSNPSEPDPHKVLASLKKSTLRNFNPDNIRWVESWPLNENLKRDRLKALAFFN